MYYIYDRLPEYLLSLPLFRILPPCQDYFKKIDYYPPVLMVSTIITKIIFIFIILIKHETNI